MSEKGSILPLALAAVGAYVIFGEKSSAANPGTNPSSSGTVPDPNYSERGYRNHNPGDIVKSDIMWLGKITPSSDNVYEQFDSMEHGLRALMKNLIAYYNLGYNNISKIIGEWSGGNNTPQYIASVSADLGIDANTPLATASAGGTLTKPGGGTLKRTPGLSGSFNDNLIPLAKAIVKWETGSQKLPDSMYQTAYGMI